MFTPREAGGKSDSRAAGSTSILKVLEDEAARAGAPYGREEPISQVDRLPPHGLEMDHPTKPSPASQKHDQNKMVI